MASTGAAAISRTQRTARDRRSLPAWLAMSPSLALIIIFVYGFIGWTAYVSLSASRMTPDWAYVGLKNYWRLWRNDPWNVAVRNLLIFSILYVGIGMLVGLLLAILVDQRVRAEGVFRTIFLYPAAVSLVVTGVVWKWILNPGTGIESFVRSLGYETFEFGWITSDKTVLYALVIAAVWQVAGFAMALFLASLRAVDQEIVKAARLDGGSAWRIYFHIILPSMRWTFVTVFVLLTAFAIKTFDLVVAMTAEGPGYSSTFPATFMYNMAFWRNQLGVSAASAITLLAFALVLISPYVLFRGARDDRA